MHLIWICMVWTILVSSPYFLWLSLLACIFAEYSWFAYNSFHNILQLFLVSDWYRDSWKSCIRICKLINKYLSTSFAWHWNKYLRTSFAWHWNKYISTSFAWHWKKLLHHVSFWSIMLTLCSCLGKDQCVMYSCIIIPYKLEHKSASIGSDPCKPIVLQESMQNILVHDLLKCMSICIKQDGYGTVAGEKIEVQPGVNHECQSGAFPTEPLKLLEGCYMEDCYSIWRVAFFSAYGGLVLTINDTRFSLRLKLCLLP